nr:MAG TPA: hypothetical protein [Caudoviricetes sp.]
MFSLNTAFFIRFARKTSVKSRILEEKKAVQTVRTSKKRRTTCRKIADECQEKQTGCIE